jgi:hypothetical protein
MTQPPSIMFPYYNIIIDGNLSIIEGQRRGSQVRVAQRPESSAAGGWVKLFIFEISQSVFLYVRK